MNTMNNVIKLVVIVVALAGVFYVGRIIVNKLIMAKVVSTVADTAVGGAGMMRR